MTKSVIGASRFEKKGVRSYEVSFYAPSVTISARRHDAKWAIARARKLVRIKDLVPSASLVYIDVHEDGSATKYY